MSRTQCQCTLFLLLGLFLSSSWLKSIIFAKDPYHPDEYEYVCIYGIYEYITESVSTTDHPTAM